MTSLLTPTEAPPESGRGPRHLALSAASGAVAAVGVPLALCAALAVIGWFMADAGSHGDPSDALRVGALGWLVAHGSGINIQGAWVTAQPLVVTIGCAMAVWHFARRTGEAVSGHGPDADRIADGERDWTVPGATAAFAATYTLLVVLVGAVASTAATDPSLLRAAVFSLLLCLVVGGTGVAVGSGRAALWLTHLPRAVHDSLNAAWSILRWFAIAATVCLVAALLVDLTSAANIVSQLDTDVTDTIVVVLLSALLLPNAIVCSGTYLLGHGFAVGTGTLVTPTAVVLGPLPLFPLLAALPGDGPTPPWTPALLAVPPVVAAWATWRVLRERPVHGWSEAALRGLAAGVLAAVAVAVAAGLANGAVGPGRMQMVGPGMLDTLARALPTLGLAGLVGSMVATWQHRRQGPAESD